MSLSVPGIGSGLDIEGIVNQLAEMERRPILQLQAAKEKLGTQLSSFGLLQSYLSNLQSAATQLGRADFWSRSTATSSDPTVATVALSGSAVPASYALEVESLASAQSLASPVFADPLDVGTGTLTIRRGADSVEIVIAAGTSLEALRDRINGAEAGVGAAIVTDASGPRLVLTATATGVANAVTITASGDATGALAGLTHPGALQERAATDARFTINGLSLTSASNRLEGVIDGLDVTLAKVTAGPVQLSVATDTEALAKGVRDFVAAYNEINTFLRTQTRFDEGARIAGPLQGDRQAVGLLNRLRSLVQQPSESSPTFSRLSDLGLSLQRDGSLKVDDARLQAALADPGAVAAAFTAPETGLVAGFKTLADGMLGTGGALTSRTEGLRDRIRRNEREQERVEDRVDRVRERLLRQYAALDANLGRLNGLNDYVMQQITSWNNQKSG